jgi:hypothetical protein
MGSSLSKRAGLTLLSPPAQSEAEAPMGPSPQEAQRQSEPGEADRNI